MDQNSANDTDKRNWRERLGIGGKDLPRISGEFAKTPRLIAEEVRRAPGAAGGKTSPHGSTPAHEGRPHLRRQAPPAGRAAGRCAAGPGCLGREASLPARRCREIGRTAGNGSKTARRKRPRQLQPPPRHLLLRLLLRKSQNSVLPMRKPRRTSAASPAPCHQAARRKGQPPSSPSFRRPGHPSDGQPRIPTGTPAAGFQPQYRPQPPRSYSPSAYVPATPVTATAEL